MFRLKLWLLIFMVFLNLPMDQCKSTSRKQSLFLELINNSILQKSAYMHDLKPDTIVKSIPLVTFIEYKFDFPGPESSSSKINQYHPRMKRDESGVLHANNINAQNINTNKMFAKNVLADIVKAEKVKAIVISIGRAFSVLKAVSPTGAPDTLVLNRNGPDPTDTAVTIVLEREGHPISINGHQDHEEEKHKLLDLKNRFVKKQSTRDDRLGTNIVATSRQRTVLLKGNSGQNTKHQLPLPKAAINGFQNRLQQANNNLKLAKLNENRHQNFINMQGQTKPGVAQGGLSKPNNSNVNTFIVSRNTLLTPLQKQRLIMMHWKNNMLQHQQKMALQNRTIIGQLAVPLNRVKNSYGLNVGPTLHPSNKGLLTAKIIPNQAHMSTLKHTPPFQINSLVQKKNLKNDQFPSKKDEYLAPVISKVQKGLQEDARIKYVELMSDDSDSFETDEKDVDKKLGVSLKEFEKTVPSFDWENDDFFYDGDKTEVDYFESSDEKETYTADTSNTKLSAKQRVGHDKETVKSNDDSFFSDSDELNKYDYYTDKSSENDEIVSSKGFVLRNKNIGPLNSLNIIGFMESKDINEVNGNPKKSADNLGVRPLGKAGIQNNSKIEVTPKEDYSEYEDSKYEFYTDSSSETNNQGAKKSLIVQNKSTGPLHSQNIIGLKEGQTKFAKNDTSDGFVNKKAVITLSKSQYNVSMFISKKHTAIAGDKSQGKTMKDSHFYSDSEMSSDLSDVKLQKNIKTNKTVTTNINNKPKQSTIEKANNIKTDGGDFYSDSEISPDTVADANTQKRSTNKKGNTVVKDEKTKPKDSFFSDSDWFSEGDISDFADEFYSPEDENDKTAKFITK